MVFLDPVNLRKSMVVVMPQAILTCRRQTTKPKDIAYSPYLYSLGLPYGSTAKALNRFVERSHMCQSGNGFRNTGQRDCQPGEKRLMGMLLVKPRLRLAPNTCGFGLQSDDKNTWKSFGLTCRLKGGQCLWPSGLLRLS
jgi:hypothetical protein